MLAGTIRFKLAACMGLLVFTAMAVGLFGVYKLNESNHHLVYTGQVLGGRLVWVGEARNDYMDMTRIQKNMCLESDASKMPSWVEKQNKAIAKFEEDLQEWEKIASPEGKQMIAQVHDKFGAWRDMNNRIAALAAAGKRDEAAHLSLTSVTVAFTPTVTLLNDAIKLCSKQREAETVASGESYASSRNILLLAVLLGCGAAFLIAWFAVDRVIGKIRQLSAYIKDVAEGEGDLTKRIVTVDQDELAETAYWFNQFMDRLQKIIRDVSQTAARIADAGDEILASSTAVAASARQQRDQTVRVATAMQEMNATVMQVNDNAAQANDDAHHAGELATRGGEIVSSTVTAIRNLASNSRSSAATVEELGKSSDEIGKIIGAIEDIADQTNLLALNAAIEAARAGEQGRGFAVVADEVRKLADRTTTATKEIAGMIQTIQAETKKAVGAMHEGNRQVDSGVETAQQAGEALEHIIQSAQSVQQMVSMIAHAVQEQSIAGDDINSSMDEIAKMVDQSTNSSQQQAQTCQGLADMTNQLRLIVNQFKIDDGAPRRAESRRSTPPTLLQHEPPSYGMRQ